MKITKQNIEVLRITGSIAHEYDRLQEYRRVHSDLRQRLFTATPGHNFLAIFEKELDPEPILVAEDEHELTTKKPESKLSEDLSEAIEGLKQSIHPGAPPVFDENIKITFSEEGICRILAEEIAGMSNKDLGFVMLAQGELRGALVMWGLPDGDIVRVQRLVQLEYEPYHRSPRAFVLWLDNVMFALREIGE